MIRTNCLKESLESFIIKKEKESKKEHNNIIYFIQNESKIKTKILS